jgi:hypothetical protein
MSAAVETFRAISWLIFKWLLIATLVLIAISAMIAGFAYGYDWFTHARHQQNVELIVNGELRECSKDFPIHVLVGNKSERAIEKVEFRLAARRKGRSTDLAKYHSYSDDHIIPPQQGYANCWRAPDLIEAADSAALDWSIAYRHVRFQD